MFLIEYYLFSFVAYITFLLSLPINWCKVSACARKSQIFILFFAIMG